MNTLNNKVSNFDYFHCFYRQGFVFTSIMDPANVLDAIVIRSPSHCDCATPKKSFSNKTLTEHINFINKYKLEKAVIIAENINFIKDCPSLKYLEIIPAKTAADNFDYSPLYELPEIRYLSCKTEYGEEKKLHFTTIDYRGFDKLIELYVQGLGHINYNQLDRLETIYLTEIKSIENLHDFQSRNSLKKLDLTKTSIKTLDGIGEFNKLQQLSIAYNRSLKDVSEISKISQSLRALNIENCPRVSDLACLYELKKLEHLCLMGNNILPDLSFLKEMKQLKTFVFSFQITDNDLTPCLSVPYVHSERNKKQYNLKNRDLPKRLPEKKFELL